MQFVMFEWHVYKFFSEVIQGLSDSFDVSLNTVRVHHQLSWKIKTSDLSEMVTWSHKVKLRYEPNFKTRWWITFFARCPNFAEQIQEQTDFGLCEICSIVFFSLNVY